eukprot:TRINITY_DN766_c0_g2_i1.p1 TRINITY_DN766_c0_g2~~TRINITY_DN766_c0_g2_i1.p1  ORF type:complete len:191 (-),score=51.01 TRINITY_DN766_c0_g2_i1:101-637(-)
MDPQNDRPSSSSFDESKDPSAPILDPGFPAPQPESRAPQADFQAPQGDFQGQHPAPGFQGQQPGQQQPGQQHAFYAQPPFPQDPQYAQYGYNPNFPPNPQYQYGYPPVDPNGQVHSAPKDCHGQPQVFLAPQQPTIIMTQAPRRRISVGGIVAIIVLFIIFWPLCWVPLVIDSCYEYY